MEKLGRNLMARPELVAAVQRSDKGAEKHWVKVILTNGALIEQEFDSSAQVTLAIKPLIGDAAEGEE